MTSKLKETSEDKNEEDTVNVDDELIQQFSSEMDRILELLQIQISAAHIEAQLSILLLEPKEELVVSREMVKSIISIMERIENLSGGESEDV